MKRNEIARRLDRMALIGIITVAGICVTFVPAIGQKIAHFNPQFAHLYWPCLLGVWLLAAPVLCAGHLVRLMARDLAAGEPFHERNAARLAQIARLAWLDVGVFIAGAVLLMAAGALPPFMLPFAATAVFAGIGVATAAQTFSCLLEDATLLRNENDLTV